MDESWRKKRLTKRESNKEDPVGLRFSAEQNFGEDVGGLLYMPPCEAKP